MGSSRLIEVGELEALLQLGRHDPDDEVRAAALGVAAGLPLSPGAWQGVAEALAQLIESAPPRSAARRQALKAATHVSPGPLREWLRQLAMDPGERDRDVLLGILHSAADVSRTPVPGVSAARKRLRSIARQLVPGLSRDDKLRILRDAAKDAEIARELRADPAKGAAAVDREGTEGDPGRIGEAVPRGARRGRGFAAASPPATAASPRTGDAVPPDEEARRVNAQILHDGQLRRSFVTGADNVIRCWIGLPEPERAASADRAVPQVPIPAEGLELTAELYWNDQRDSKRLILPAERTARSGDCDLRLHVPEGERFVSAEIMFRYRGRAFEVVRVEAFALAPGEVEEAHHQIQVRVQASRREVIELHDSQPVDSTLVFGDHPPQPEIAERPATPAAPPAAPSPTLRVFGGEGGKGYDLADAGVAIRWLNETLFATEKLVVRRQAAQGQGGAMGGDGRLDADDPDVRTLLRDMARHGAGLYNQLRDQGFTDPGERIQVLNQDPDTYVPLEFVYDRGYPVRDSTLCRPGLDALHAGDGACPVCETPATDDERSAAPVICPFGFWSLRKIIERVAPGDGGQVSAPGATRRSLPAIDAVAFASSHLVPENERAATCAALQQSPGHLAVADDWNEWREALRTHPPLLVVLPHHGVQAALDYLEIGDPQLGEDLGKLSHAQIGRQYVNPDGRDPGPIVLLLGCQTGAESETGYVQITRRIQQQRASIVLGTLAQILGRHAAPLARELVAELVAVDDAQADFGTIMRRVRRRMLARGYLMALCLVALGDAEWRLTPRQPAALPGSKSARSSAGDSAGDS